MNAIVDAIAFDIVVLRITIRAIFGDMEWLMKTGNIPLLVLIASVMIWVTHFEISVMGELSAEADTQSKVEIIGEIIPESSPAQIKRKIVYRTNPGPWGNLEYYIVYLCATDDQLDAIEPPESVTVWSFESDDMEKVRKQLRRILKGKSDSDWLGKSESFRVTGEYIELFPPDSVILDLSADQRSELARILRVQGENPYYTDPVIIESSDPTSWFLRAGLSASTVEVIEKLCYQLGQTVVFSDIPYVYSYVQTIGGEETHRFLEALSRTRALVVRLVVDESSDFSSISTYWGAGNHNKMLQPILNSVFENNEVERLDIVHLLTPTARKLINTYPDLSMGIRGKLPDCHWTSLNFFNYQPVSKLLEELTLQHEVASKYNPVKEPLEFGDVLLLLDQSEKRVVHSCVYIADDIVFTKNGLGLMSPWIMMRFGDMIMRYQMDGSVVTRAYRLK